MLRIADGKFIVSIVYLIVNEDHKVIQEINCVCSGIWPSQRSVDCVCNILEWSCMTSSCMCSIRISCIIRVIVFIVVICSWNKNVRIWVDIQLVNMSKVGTV